ncbi:2-phosphosulfolactate phosphatase [bacterium]|nr:2-phosphosulfolactate phosphatase [bacterium]
MDIDVTFTSDDYDDGFSIDRIIVVIDVLRASTSIITALAHGAEKVIPVSTPEEAFALKTKFDQDEVLLCGERDGLIIRGFDLGNSPWEYTREQVENKTLVFSSTNGSQLLSKVTKQSERVMIGSIVNEQALTDCLIKTENNVVFACAGREGRFSLEDAVYAGMLVHGIRKRESKPCESSDAAYAAEQLYLLHADNLENMMRLSFHGRYLIELGFIRDISFCAQRNRFAIIPVFSQGAFVAT